MNSIQSASKSLAILDKVSYYLYVEDRMKKYLLIVSVLLIACNLLSIPATTTATPAVTAAMTLAPTAVPTSVPEDTATPTVPPILSDFPIYTDYENPENVPTIDFGILTSPAFVDKVLDMDTRGRFPDFPNRNTLIPIISVSTSLPPELYERNDWLVITSGNGYSPYYNPKSRPYMLVLELRTQFDGKGLYVFIEKYRNKDRTNGFIGFTLAANNYDTYLGGPYGLLSPYFGNFLTGTYYVNQDDAEQIYGCHNTEVVHGGLPQAYCDWYFANTEITQGTEVLKNWSLTGNLSNVFTVNGETYHTIPLVPIAGQTISPP
jgi:hypothetical protein